MPMKIDLDKLYNRILIGDGTHIDLVNAAVDALARYQEEVDAALAASPARGGESLETVIDALELGDSSDRVLAALGVILYLNERSANGLSSDAPNSVSYDQVMDVLERVEGLPLGKRVGLNKGLKELAQALREQNRARHSFQDALVAKVVDLETEFRYGLFREIWRETRWMPPREGIRGAVEAELTLGCNLRAYPLAPKQDRSGYKQFLTNYGIDASLVRAIKELEEDKDQLMMGALSILANRTGSLEAVRGIKLEDWENALRSGNLDKGAAEWRKIHEIALEVDTELNRELNRILEEDTKVYQRIAQGIGRVVNPIKGLSSFPEKIESREELERAIDSYTKLYEDNTKGYIISISGNSSFNLKPGVYRVMKHRRGYSDEIWAWSAFDPEDRGVQMKKKIWTEWRDVHHMKDLAERIAKEANVSRLTLSSVLSRGELLTDIPEKNIREVVGKYFPEREKEFKARDLYSLRVQNRLERAS